MNTNKMPEHNEMLTFSPFGGSDGGRVPPTDYGYYLEPNGQGGSGDTSTTKSQTTTTTEKPGTSIIEYGLELALLTLIFTLIIGVFIKIHEKKR